MGKCLIDQCCGYVPGVVAKPLPDVGSPPYSGADKVAERLGADAVLGEGLDEFVGSKVHPAREFLQSPAQFLLGKRNASDVCRVILDRFVDKLFPRQISWIARGVEKSEQPCPLVDLIAGDDPFIDAKHRVEPALCRNTRGRKAKQQAQTQSQNRL